MHLRVVRLQLDGGFELGNGVREAARHFHEGQSQVVVRFGVAGLGPQDGPILGDGVGQAARHGGEEAGEIHLGFGIVRLDA